MIHISDVKWLFCPYSHSPFKQLSISVSIYPLFPVSYSQFSLHILCNSPPPLLFWLVLPGLPGGFPLLHCRTVGGVMEELCFVCNVTWIFWPTSQRLHSLHWGSGWRKEWEENTDIWTLYIYQQSMYTFTYDNKWLDNSSFVRLL